MADFPARSAGGPNPRTNLGSAVSVGNVAFLSYVALVFFANVANAALGSAAFGSVSLLPLGALCLLGILNLGRRGSTVRTVLTLGLLVPLAVVALVHLPAGPADQVRLFGYVALGILAGAGLTRLAYRSFERVLLFVSAVFLATGVASWWIHVAQGDGTALSLYHRMVFAKQDYSLVFTCVAGLLLYEAYRARGGVRWRRVRTLYYVFALIVAVVLLNVKTVLVALAGGYLLLAAFRVFAPRTLVLLALLGTVALGAGATGLLPVRLLPENLQPFVLYLTGRPVPSEEARYLDSLAMRQEILAENLGALSRSPTAALFGLGENAVRSRTEPFVSPHTGRVYDLPSALESGFLWMLVVGGLVGLVGALLYLLIPLGPTARALRREPADLELALLACVGAALVASNLLQDNTNSLVWVWFGVLWTRHYRARWQARLAHPGAAGAV